jgi:CDP-diacylglycerol--glycerol-3-phosphate 3-phosphatidyltransferase
MPLIALPLALTLFRLILGPVLLAVAWTTPGSGPWLAACLIPAILSDLFDGILARRFGVARPWLRRLDSQTDQLFWQCVLGCIGVLHPHVLRQNAFLILALLALEAIPYLISFARFGKEPCTHALSFRVWSVVLVACTGVVLGLGEQRWALRVLFVSYLVPWLDVFFILVLLPVWRNDVPSCLHAYRLRMQAAELPAHG